MTVSLTWEQIAYWRMDKQHLTEQAPQSAMLDVVRDTCGVQAQVMSAAELAISARVQDITSDVVQNALWQAKSLVKAWTMRGTLHLMNAADIPLYVAALRATRLTYRKASWLKYHGITGDQIDAITEGVKTALDSRTLTREQLAGTIAEQASSPHLRDLLLSGWGALLKPASFQGYICFGPSQGQTVTFVRPDQWLGTWQEIDSDTALKEVLRRYLAVYGPSTKDIFCRWWGIEPRDSKKLFQSMGDELTDVEVEGWKGQMLAADVKAVQHTAPKGVCVRLLGNFDPYTLTATRDIDYLLPAQFKAQVSRTSGWISPVVLVNGRIMGVWRQEEKKREITVTITPFADLSADVKRQIESEGQRLAGYFGGEVMVAYE